jgi:hypothetical protein
VEERLHVLTNKILNISNPVQPLNTFITPCSQMLRWLSEREHYQGSRKLRVTRGKVGDMIRAQGLPVPPDCGYEAPYKKPKQSALDPNKPRGERRPKKQARSKYGVRGRQ